MKGWSTLAAWAFPPHEAAATGAAGWPASWAVKGWAGAFVLAGAMGATAVGFGADVDGSSARLTSQFGIWTGFVATAIIASRVYGSGRPSADFGLRASSGVIRRSIAVGVVTQLVVVPVVYVPFALAGMDLDVSGAAESLLTDLGLTERLIVVVGVIAVAPITEELLFRGILLRGLARSMSVNAALVLSAVLFAATHFQLVQFPGLVAVGLVLAWLAARTGGLAAPIWAHVGFNATTVVVLW
jgi:membrane protease YdiL (CAAX protease family)